MIDVGLIIARLLHYTATTVLFGASLFPFYAYARAEPEILQGWRTRLVWVAAIGAVLSGLSWFPFSVANMSGSLSDLSDGEVLWAVVRNTSFGVIWTTRMLLAVMIAVVTAVHRIQKTSASRTPVLPALAAVLIVSLAGTGHAQVEEGWARVLHVLSDAAHLLAAGAWLGGLLPLGFLLTLRARLGNEIDIVLSRFSGVGYTAVATLLVSGTINCWFLVGSPENLVGTRYGQLLLLKLILFGLMVLLAGSNRFWLVPALARSIAASRSERLLMRLRGHVLGEQVLGLLVLGVVSGLGTLDPAIHGPIPMGCVDQVKSALVAG